MADQGAIQAYYAQQRAKHHKKPTATGKIPKGLPVVQQIFFYGQAANDPSSFYSFSVLVGDQPPQITGGYAKWQVIDRPLRRGLTIFQGYDPTSMQLQVRFMVMNNGSWQTDKVAGNQVEVDIAKLEWMAGQAQGSDPSPFVYLSTQDTNGDTSALIPFNYQNSPSSNVPHLLKNKYVWPWVIFDLQWDADPIRNSLGLRIRQDATVTLSLFGSPGGAQPSVAHRTTKSLKGKALAVTARSGDTALSIAGRSITGDRYTLAKAIIKYSKNAHLKLRLVGQKIKAGTKVWVPYDY